MCAPEPANTSDKDLLLKIKNHLAHFFHFGLKINKEMDSWVAEYFGGQMDLN
jgi:hypothetical protein